MTETEHRCQSCGQLKPYDPQKRRRWTQEQKTRIVEESIKVGSIKNTAWRHNIHPRLLMEWKKQWKAQTQQKA